ncbi:hypothetical protein DAPPUDRAFT_113102 [Daphnia pulex]|uniref:Uncharacterized protein n=1 Tax=Daphnia pulex TaxID=6669 RepID=E9HE27_DAPPU|nr:hypothetical protein DAPPUDRAFT_113102 [Daphnia pulex]|eukprot:EFX70028.1 hypothetical protein DAPPUDRAFT_113102 [Daphnia pulex]
MATLGLASQANSARTGMFSPSSLSPGYTHLCYTTARSAGIPRFAILSANHKNVVDLDSGALPVSTSDNMTNLFAMHRALVPTARELQSHEHVEIISPSTKLLSFLILGKLVSSLQLNCLDSMVPIRHNTSFYVAQDLSSSYRFRLTRVICESSDIRHPVIELRQPKEVAGAVASMLIKSLHEREWASGLNDTTTRSFFPTVHSASMLLSAQLNCQLSQILSGHSALNTHQYRFKFRPSPAYSCATLGSASLQHVVNARYPGLPHSKTSLRTGSFGQQWCDTSL